MKEIGGYIELDSYHLPMLHDDAIALNCGRNCLVYLFKSRGIKKIKLPYFICDSVINVCDREGVEKDYYHIGLDFKPTSELRLEPDEWLYLVNYYGQLNNEEIMPFVEKYKRVIVDQANGYYEKPILGVDTLYTCRKWFGVSDGAFLYTDKRLEQEFQRDVSFNRMRFLLGRFESTASEFYEEYTLNNKFFANEPIKHMSKLTENLLHGIDYSSVKKQRNENFQYLNQTLGDKNFLKLKPGLFMYPLIVDNGKSIRKQLMEHKIYIPTLWPAVFEITNADDLEYQMAENILPLPIDQRYCIGDMKYMAELILSILKG